MVDPDPLVPPVAFVSEGAGHANVVAETVDDRTILLVCPEQMV
jgi:hypothetical protein